MNGLIQPHLVTTTTMVLIIGVGFVFGLLVLLPLLGISMYSGQVKRWITRLSITPSSADAYISPTDRQRARVEQNLPDSASDIRIYVDATATESARADAMGFLVTLPGNRKYGKRSIVVSEAAFDPENRIKLPGLVSHEYEHLRQKDTRERAILIDVGAITGFIGILGIYIWIYGITGRDLWLVGGVIALLVASIGLLRLSSRQHRNAEYRADAAASARASRRSILKLLEDYDDNDDSDGRAAEDILLGVTHPSPSERIKELTKPLAKCEEL